jgi:eukaryotic-like serine/threonine-protein kinase
MPRTVAPGDGPCPSEEQLFAYAAGSGRTSDPEKLLIHLDGCSTCRHLLAEASRSLEASHSPAPSPAKIRTFGDGDLVVDRYRIERFLAQGGMGEVYVAQDLLLEETVALKTLSCTALDDQRAAFRCRSASGASRASPSPS